MINNEILTLTDEDGNNIKMRILDTFEYEESEYTALCPVDINDGEEEIDIVLLRVIKTGKGVLEEIEDEKLLSDVFKMLLIRAELNNEE